MFILLYNNYVKLYKIRPKNIWRLRLAKTSAAVAMP